MIKYRNELIKSCIIISVHLRLPTRLSKGFQVNELKRLAKDRHQHHLHSYFLVIGGYFALIAFCPSVKSSSRSSITLLTFFSAKKNTNNKTHNKLRAQYSCSNGGQHLARHTGVLERTGRAEVDNGTALGSDYCSMAKISTVICDVMMRSAVNFFIYLFALLNGLTWPRKSLLKVGFHQTRPRQTRRNQHNTVKDVSGSCSNRCRNYFLSRLPGEFAGDSDVYG